MKQGFSLVETLLASSLFSLLVTALVGAILFGQESTATAGARSRAVMIAEEGLEASRNIHDNNFSELTNGNHGLAISANQWVFSGSSDTVDTFTRQITITTPSTDRRQTVSTVSWQQTPSRAGSVAFVTYLTNWRAAAGGGVGVTACAPVCASLGYSSGNCRQNAVQCGVNGETYEASGDASCVTGNPGDSSHDTCCCQP